MEKAESKSVIWPLIFTYRGTIAGTGFLAEINLQGRVTASLEPEGVWIYGVNPGAIAVSAPTLALTNTELRAALTRLFIEFAREATRFADFKSAVETFLSETDELSVAEWQSARDDVRAGRITVPNELQRVTDETPFSVEITAKELNTVTPQDNLLVQEESTTRTYATAA